MPRPSNTEARRAQITEALIQVMAREGYSGASIAQIARAADLAPGLVHYHFESKDAILHAAIESVTADGLARVAELAADDAAGAPSRVARFIDIHVGMGASADPERLACWILFTGEALRRPELAEKIAAVFDRLVDALERILVVGAERWELSGERTRAAAVALVAAIQGYYVMAAIDRSLVPLGSAAPSLRAMAQGLLGVDLPELPETSSGTRDTKAKGRTRSARAASVRGHVRPRGRGRSK